MQPIPLFKLILDYVAFTTVMIMIGVLLSDYFNRIGKGK